MSLAWILSTWSTRRLTHRSVHLWAVVSSKTFGGKFQIQHSTLGDTSPDMSLQRVQNWINKCMTQNINCLWWLYLTLLRHILEVGLEHDILQKDIKGFINIHVGAIAGVNKSGYKIDDQQRHRTQKLNLNGTDAPNFLRRRSTLSVSLPTLSLDRRFLQACIVILQFCEANMFDALEDTASTMASIYQNPHVCVADS